MKTTKIILIVVTILILADVVSSKDGDELGMIRNIWGPDHPDNPYNTTQMEWSCSKCKQYHGMAVTICENPWVWPNDGYVYLEQIKKQKGFIFKANSNLTDNIIPIPSNQYLEDVSGKLLEGHVSCVPVGTAEVWVDDDYDEASCTVDGHVWQYDCFDNVEDGIAAVAENGRVNISAGIYSPKSIITINKDNIIILGPQSGIEPRPSQGNIRAAGSADEAIIDGNHDLNKIIKIDANNVIINGLEIKSSVEDIIKQSNTHSGTIVKYNIIHDGQGEDGIKLKSCINCTVEHNYIYDIATSEGAVSFVDSLNCAIRYNEVYNISSAIYVDSSENIEILGNLIYDLYLNEGIKLGDENGNYVSRTDGLIKDNIIYDGAQGGIAVYMSRVTIEGNEVYDCHSENGAVYLGYDIKDITIKGNKIYNNILNTSKWNNSAGILIGDIVNVTSVSIVNNGIYNNTPYGITNHGSDSLDAEKNYWGCSLGPSTQGCDNISGNVDYSPWYSSSDMVSICGTTYDDGENKNLTLSKSTDLTSNNITVKLPAGISITGESSWDGTINAPTIEQTPTIHPVAEAGFTSAVEKIFEVGFPDIKLIFDRAIKILISGEGGGDKRVGYVRGEDFHKITIYCSGNNQTWADNNLNDEEDCYFDDGADLFVWTKHLTQFIVYTQIPKPPQQESISNEGSNKGKKWVYIEISEPIEEEPIAELKENASEGKILGNKTEELEDLTSEETVIEESTKMMSGLEAITGKVIDSTKTGSKRKIIFVIMLFISGIIFLHLKKRKIIKL